ncbi:MFS transporter [Picrophilus oshimae]|uniref:Sugar transport protein n=1 Tax=Picrophilus torridus (strain ATCC 700027 / DSM 9790 / JCM 10055 / NBRC 100828 / KAW 2/3) TaxID=1122961 RepID=Q6L109_PICTO|nr:MFS transporter [Picrophilus oshimae]AAT43343.1 sugar transport protein [Picrophilus oshimae DSM 9789]
MESVSFDEIPASRKLLKITLLSSAGVIMDGYVLSIYAVALLYLKNYFMPLPYQISLMASSALLGMFFGSLTFGYLSDRFGRKKIYEYDLLITSVFLFLTGLSRNVIEFIIFEVLAGIGIGADYPISSSIQAEFSPRNVRGKYLIYNIFNWNIGFIAFYIVSIFFVLYTGLNAWRYMYISAAAIPLIVVLLRRSMPESPYYLIKSGHYESAIKVENEFYKNVKNPYVNGGRTEIRELFSKKYLKYTIFVSIAWFSYDVASYGIWTYTPSLFSDTSSYIISVLGSLLEEVPVILGFIVLWYLIERAGRRRMEIIGFLLPLIPMLLLYFTGSMGFLILFFMFGFMHFSHNLGPGELTFTYPVEIFPTRIRSTAMGFATLSSRIGAILGVVAFPVIMYSFGFKYSMLFFAVFEIIGLIVTVRYAPETKKKPLDAI